MDDGDNIMEKFIQQHLAQYVEKIERIIGGLGNLTFRLYLKTELPPISTNISDQNSLIALIHQLKPTSLIAKLAFPYVAAYDKYPFPLSRQRIEEEALNLFDNSLLHPVNNRLKSNDLSFVLHRNRTIKIPHALFRDETNNVLSMEDLGFLPTIGEWLISEDKSSKTELTICQTQAYGEQLGTFIADMQISSLPFIAQLNSLLHNPAYVKIVSTMHYPNIQQILNDYNVPDANELSSVALRYRSYNVSEAAISDKVLSHGDLWAPQILINTSDRTLGIVDWELSCVDSPAQDLARLTASCHLLTLSYSSNRHILQLLNSFMDAYREVAIKKKVDWFKNDHKKYLFAWSLGVLYGITLIQLANVTKFCCCQQRNCCHRYSFVLLGADYLRRARSGPEKDTYDYISRDQILSRLFQGSQ